MKKNLFSCDNCDFAIGPKNIDEQTYKSACITNVKYVTTKTQQSPLSIHIKSCANSMCLSKKGFCFGRLTLLYFNLKLLVHFYFNKMKVHKKFHVKILKK